MAAEYQLNMWGKRKNKPNPRAESTRRRPSDSVEPVDPEGPSCSSCRQELRGLLRGKLPEVKLKIGPGQRTSPLVDSRGLPRSIGMRILRSIPKHMLDPASLVAHHERAQFWTQIICSCSGFFSLRVGWEYNASIGPSHLVVFLFREPHQTWSQRGEARGNWLLCFWPGLGKGPLRPSLVHPQGEGFDPVRPRPGGPNAEQLILGCEICEALLKVTNF